ncbi:hypothetical protein [Pseudomonas sp. PS01297]|uniref:hypothetical protein n=1 Tax=Pseudomonas sp. PS01297 TaxID=2991433 RepID=UPI00249C361E|nr:hypothetical protein [Pseudomonas sp. PS01297]
MSQSENTLFDLKGRVVQSELVELARTAISLKSSGNSVVVAIGEHCSAGAGCLGGEVYRAGYAAMVVSQTKLMAEWEKCFSNGGELSAQVLVDAVVFHNELRGQQLAGVLCELTDMGVVPIVGLSAGGRGACTTLLDSFLLTLLDDHKKRILQKVAV